MTIENLTTLKSRFETGDTIDQAATHNLLESLQQGNRKATIPDAHTELHTDTDHDVQISAGSAWAMNDDYLLKWDSAQVKQIDASWASGTNAGGLSSSLSLTADTWYHLFVFEIGGTVEFGWDTSITAANLIADHSAGAYRRIASHISDASSNFRSYRQWGNHFALQERYLLDTTSPATSITPIDLEIPHSQCMAIVSMQANQTTSSDKVFALYETLPGSVAKGVNRLYSKNSVIENCIAIVSPDDSQQVGYACSTGGTWTTVRATGLGWFDFFTV